jgi:hypothetical protein
MHDSLWSTYFLKQEDLFMKLVSMLAGLLVVVFLVSLSLPFAAQAKDQAIDMANARASIRAQKLAVVKANMEFTESEAKAFWPLYEEYQAELEKVGDRMADLIKNFGITYKVMTDDTAAMLLKKSIGIQGDRIKLQEKYLPKFDKVLPMTKVARYYQIENKYRAALDTEISSKIPLIE